MNYGPLQQDEIDFIRDKERCESCGHLNALHNFHCCEYCKIPGCRCEMGKVQTEEHWREWNTYE